eukprot:1188103-Prorocentrum_minimum.AAC.4
MSVSSPNLYLTVPWESTTNACGIPRTPGDTIPRHVSGGVLLVACRVVPSRAELYTRRRINARVVSVGTRRRR